MIILSILTPNFYWDSAKRLVTFFRRHRGLIWALTKRELTEKYAGQFLGAFWAIGHPLFMMMIYLFVFGIVFKARHAGARELPMDHSVFLLSGLIPWLTASMSMGNASVIILNSVNLVKQVVFPVEALPVKVALGSILSQVIFTVTFVCYVVITQPTLPLTYALIPVLLILQTMFLIGLNFYISAISVCLRDFKELVQMFCLANLYLIPVIYPPQWIPRFFKPVLMINPFSYMTWCYQDALFYGRFEHPWAWWVYGGMSLFMILSGYKAFCKLRLIFGNLL